MLPPMNSIKNITSGLASSLFLAAGLTQLAERTEPTFNRDSRALKKVDHAKSCEMSVTPCFFTPQSGQ